MKDREPVTGYYYMGEILVDGKPTQGLIRYFPCARYRGPIDKKVIMEAKK
jgi:hypothetical protein